MGIIDTYFVSEKGLEFLNRDIPADNSDRETQDDILRLF